MAVIEMKKVILVGMQDEKEDILKAIQSMGNLEIMGIEEQGEGQDGEETPGYGLGRGSKGYGGGGSPAVQTGIYLGTFQ